MNYGTAETEIVARINEQIVANNATSLYEAVLMPETEAEYKTFYSKFTKARVAVQFIDSLPQLSNSTNKVAQEEIVRFRLSFEAKKLRGAGGLYAFMQLVKLILIGHKLTDAIDRLTLVKYGLLEFEQGAWQPYFEFECKFVNAQSFDDFSDDVPFGSYPITVSFPPEAFSDNFTSQFQ
jgi:hypothetical protein